MKHKDKKETHGHADKKKRRKDRMARVGGETFRRGARHMRWDDIPTDTFTPRTYQVELLESALQGNTIACLGSESSKLFLGLMVLRQLAHQVRPPLHLGGKRSVYLVNSEEDVDNVWSTLFHHTDMAIGRVTPPPPPGTPPVTTAQSRKSPTAPKVQPQTAGPATAEDEDEDKTATLPGKVENTTASKEDSARPQKDSVIPQEGQVAPKKEPVAPEEEMDAPQKESVVTQQQGQPVIPEKEAMTSDKESIKPQDSPTPPHQGETMTVEEVEPSSWTAEKWSSLFAENNVLVLSAQVFLSCLEKGYLSLEPINLLVLDNCHLAEGEHPYVQIMSHITQAAQAAPHLLCLTAAILGSEVSDPTQLAARIHRLEETLNSRAETSMLVISERFGCRPKESVIKCLGDEDTTGMVAKLSTILHDTWDFLEDCKLGDKVPPSKHDPLHVPKFAVSECYHILLVLGPWCAASIAENLISQLEKIVKHESNPTLKLFLRYTITQLRVVGKTFEQGFMPDYLVDELLQYTTPKVQQLIGILRKYKPDMEFMIITREGDNDDETMSDLSDDDANDDDDDFDLSSSDGEDGKGKSKHIHIAVKKKEKEESEGNSNPFEEEKKLSGVVFVDNRYVAFALNKMVEEVCAWDENLCFVKSSHITGQGVHRADGKKDLSKAGRKQEEVLRKFRMQERNLLISTKVLEEGVDIPKCNLVVRFDHPQDYRSYTLSKGRARSRDAEYVILVDDNLMENFSEQIQIFKGIEQVLIGAGRGRQDLEDAQHVDHLDQLDFTPLPTFCPLNQPGAPAVSMKTAIGLVNRYCAKLPSDAFTHLTPHCRVCPAPDEPSLFVAYLRLPVNSPIKEELQGAVMPSRQLAKMAVALQMSQLLFKAGELDSHLQPVGKEMFVCEEEEEWEEEEEGVGQGRPGTTKRKQYYIKKTADAFVSSGPKTGDECFLYSISMTLTGPITEDQNTRGRKIYAPQDSLQSFGILLSEQIPHVPSFPVYTRSGEVTVWLDLLRKATYSEDQLEKLVGFHHFVFSSVLHLEKDPMLFSPETADVGLLIVPLNTATAVVKGQPVDIEWSFVEQVNQKTVVQKGNTFSLDSPRPEFSFQQEQFEDAVVMPSYRNMDQPQHFYVAEIRHDLSPLSPFPSPELYKTFAAYYTTKYGLTLTNVDQPLLDVDHTSARLNLLTPRYMNQKGRALPTSSLETKRARRENLQQKQILVPELCDIHIFSASLWRKAVCLPAILYRLNYLLLAEELRRHIAGETGIGLVDLDPDFRFPRLDFGFETKPEKLQLPGQADPDTGQADPEKSGETAGTAADTAAQKDAQTCDVDTKKEIGKSGVCAEKRPEKLIEREENGINGGGVEAKEKDGAKAEGSTVTKDCGQKLEQAGVNGMGAKVNDKRHASLVLVETKKGSEGVDSSPDEDKTDTGASSDSDSGVVLSESEAGGHIETASVVNDRHESGAEHSTDDGTGCSVGTSSHLKVSLAPGTPKDTLHTLTSQAGASASALMILSTVCTHGETAALSPSHRCQASVTVGQGDLDSLVKEGCQVSQGADLESSVTESLSSVTESSSSVIESSESSVVESSISESSTSLYPDSEECEVFVTPSSTRSPSPTLSTSSDHSVYEDAVEVALEDSAFNSAHSPHQRDVSLDSVVRHVCDGDLDQHHSGLAIVPPKCSVCLEGSSMEQTCDSGDGEGVCHLGGNLEPGPLEPPPSKPVTTPCHSHQVPPDTAAESTSTTSDSKCSCLPSIVGADPCGDILSADRPLDSAERGPETCSQAQGHDPPPSQLVGDTESCSPGLTTLEPAAPEAPCTNNTVIIEDCEDPEDVGSGSRNGILEECDDFLDVTGTSSSRKWLPSHSLTMPVETDASSFTLPQEEVHITFDKGPQSGLDSDWAQAACSTSVVEWGVGENLTTFEVSGSLAEGEGAASSDASSGKASQNTDSVHTSAPTHSDSSHSPQSACTLPPTHSDAPPHPQSPPTSPHMHSDSSPSHNSQSPHSHSDSSQSSQSAHNSPHMDGDSSHPLHPTCSTQKSATTTTTPSHFTSTSEETHSPASSGQVSGAHTCQEVQRDSELYIGATSSSVEHSTSSTMELSSVSNTKHTSVTHTGCTPTSKECSSDETVTEKCVHRPCRPSHVPCNTSQWSAVNGSDIGVQEQKNPAATVCDSLHSCACSSSPDKNKSLEPGDMMCNEHSVTLPEESPESPETVESGSSEECVDGGEENGWGCEEARPASEWGQTLDNPPQSSVQPIAQDCQGQEKEPETEGVDGLREGCPTSAAAGMQETGCSTASTTEAGTDTRTARTDAHCKDCQASAKLQHTIHSVTCTDSSGVREAQHTTHSTDTHSGSDATQEAKRHPDVERRAEESQADRSGEKPATSPAPHAVGEGQALHIPQSPSSSKEADQPGTFDIGTWSTGEKKKEEICDKKETAAATEEEIVANLGLIKLDEDEDLASFVGPSPCQLLQALTMSNANDFFSLERLETIGDSFLKYAITVYLYCTYPATHEGKLSYLRSKQVSNYNLYRLGRRKGLAERMVSTKFEPYENWLPPCYVISEDRRRGPVPKVVIATVNPRLSESAPINFFLEEEETESEGEQKKETEAFQQELAEIDQQQAQDQQRELLLLNGGGAGGSSHSSRNAALVPYSLQQHHGIPDKSVADCVEALIGCYLTSCGKVAALIFMAWLGLKVLPRRPRQKPLDEHEAAVLTFPELSCPPSPLLSSVPHAPQLLEHLLEGYEEFEERIQYTFRDRSYLLQAFTHASYHYNYITDCYQRLEFLGDAILDYVITRHLYEDSHRYSPGILTDLRSALVNNNIFAALAVKWDFHKFFRAISPSLFIVIDKFVVRQKGRMDEIDEIEEVKINPKPKRDTDEEDEEGEGKTGDTEGDKENLAGEGGAGGGGDEEVEVEGEDKEEEVELEIPKALGDIFESVAGAIYLDSGMSLDAVWRVYYRMMKPHIDKYLKDIPKSPVRELLEMEPETAKFEKPERTLEGKIRVTVNVVGKGVFYGVGRNYRIAKSAAAKKALRFIRSLVMEGQA